MSPTLLPAPAAERLEVLTVADPPRVADGAVDVDAVAAALAPCDVLGSTPDAGTTYVVPHDDLTLHDDGARTWLVTAGHRQPLGDDPFAALERWCAVRGLTPEATPPAGLPAFSGGLVGAFSYDLARRIERIGTRARADRRQDHLQLRLAEIVVAIPPEQDHLLVIGRDLTGRPALRARCATIAQRLRSGPPPDPLPRAGPQVVDTSLSADDYRAAVSRALEHIAAGDSFQVNLSQRLTAHWPGDAHALYRALRRHSPAAHGAVLPGCGIASVSPETFLAVRGRTVTTRPIKGTRPRASDPRLDAALADDLVAASKDRAENVMIVDLQRNDLGRVCEPGSVRVPALAELEGHPTVWHLVSTVTGRLRPGVGYGRLLAATFPCGSVTGAPKVRSMAIIESLEPVRRGWYCGAIGFLSAGAATLSVAIRTATLHPDGQVDHGAGGGVVADSDPADEHAESLDKAAAFLRAVGATTVQAAR